MMWTRNAWAQQAGFSTTPTLTGGQGNLWLSQFANPSLLGGLYMTPMFPWTGMYPIYPGSLSPILSQEEAVKAGPLRLHPFMGVAEMFTDNVFRTPTKTSDVATTLAPGIQAQLPFARRHMFVADYRTNLQFYHVNPSNNVQDQTASGLFRFDLANRLTVDLQGQHKLGHDPRGTALDLQMVEPNKWTNNNFTGRVQYEGGQMGVTFTGQTMRWTYLNNDQGISRDRLVNYLGIGLNAKVLPNTSALIDFNVQQNIYEQNKNLDSTMYTVSTGARWEVSGNTAGELLVGYQYLKFTHASVSQSPPTLSQFTRSQDSANQFFVMGNMYWTPLPSLTISAQPYRTFQQTVLAGTSFFTATGVNVSAVHTLTNRIDLTANVGYENDDFSTPAGATAATPARVDHLSNVAIGMTYRAVKWFGASLQYIFENRDSNVEQFNYQANTVMLSVQLFL